MHVVFELQDPLRTMRAECKGKKENRLDLLCWHMDLWGDSFEDF